VNEIFALVKRTNNFIKNDIFKRKKCKGVPYPVCSKPENSVSFAPGNSGVLAFSSPATALLFVSTKNHDLLGNLRIPLPLFFLLPLSPRDTYLPERKRKRLLRRLSLWLVQTAKQSYILRARANIGSITSRYSERKPALLPWRGCSPDTRERRKSSLERSCVYLNERSRASVEKARKARKRRYEARALCTRGLLLRGLAPSEIKGSWELPHGINW